jgi:hypothetical protein
MIIDPVIIEKLRTLAKDGATVPALMSIIWMELEMESIVNPVVFIYLREAFSLSLPDISPLGGWKSKGFRGYSDDEIERLVMSSIMRSRSKWE